VSFNVECLCIVLTKCFTFVHASFRCLFRLLLRRLRRWYFVLAVHNALLFYACSLAVAF